MGSRGQIRSIGVSMLLAVMLLAPTACRADVNHSVLDASRRATGFVFAEFPNVLSMGTGFCIDTSGLFVTNNHVISHEGKYGRIRVVLAPGTSGARVLNATIIKADAEMDLALLRVERPSNLHPVELADTVRLGRLHETQEVLALGYPFGLELAAPGSAPEVSVSTGKITALRHVKNELALIQFDGSINHGNSGGPLLDKYGSVIGVVTAIVPDKQINFAIPVSLVRVLLAEAHLVIAPPALTDPALASQLVQQWLSPDKDRRKVPDDAAQKASLKLVHELFASDYRDTSKAGREGLVYKLLDEAKKESDDPAGNYVLLTEAREAAVRAGDFEAALYATGELTAVYDLPSVERMIDLMHRMGSRLNGQEAADGATVDLLVIEALARKQAFAEARKWCAPTRAVAYASHNPKVTAAIAEGIDRVQFEASETDKGQAALARLKTEPNDPAANLAAGRYECFVRGDFSAGCVHLAHGSDPALKNAAAAELAKPTTPDGRRACGDQWWELAAAQAKTPLVADACKERAAYWYRQAEPKLSGLAQRAVQQRLEELGPDVETVATQVPTAPAGKKPKLVNHTDAHEAQAVIDAVATRYPQSLPASGSIELLKVHDASEFKCNGNTGPQEAKGAYSGQAVGGQCGGVPMLWGIYEKWPAGHYLIVYRIQALSDVSGERVCFLDVCTGGRTIAEHRPDAPEFASGGWSCMPVQLTLEQPQNLEFRLWSQNHPVMVDRVYVFGVK